MKDSDLLVLFDFDSLIYNKNWKIVDPKIGRIGSIKDLSWILNFYRINKNKKDFDLFSHCIPEIDGLNIISLNQIEDKNYNFFPIEKLPEAFLNHQIRGRKILFITLIYHKKILEILSNSTFFPKNTKEYFYKFEWIEYWMDINQQTSFTSEYIQLARFLFIKNLLKKKEETEEDKIQNLVFKRYSRIFYYTTDITLINLLKKFIIENMNLYEYKSNTITSFYMIQMIN